MTIYNWYLIFNRSEFLATGLTSRLYTLDLEQVGFVEVLVTLGNYLSMTYEGVFLPIGMSGKNPYEMDAHAVFEDELGNVYLGLPLDET